MLDLMETQHIAFTTILNWCNIKNHHTNENICPYISKYRKCEFIKNQLSPHAGCGSYSLSYKSLTQFPLSVPFIHIRVSHWLHLWIYFEKIDMTHETSNCRYSKLIMEYAESAPNQAFEFRHLITLCGKRPAIKMKVSNIFFFKVWFHACTLFISKVIYYIYIIKSKF